jgi:hypothetical protein
MRPLSLLHAEATGLSRKPILDFAAEPDNAREARLYLDDRLVVPHAYVAWYVAVAAVKNAYWTPLIVCTT